MVYAAYTDIRAITNLDTTDIADADVTALIVYATAQVNADISFEVKRERVEYIDSTRENNINGSNTTFYVKNWRHFICDSDDDGDVDISDITVHAVTTTGTETTATVSTITPNDGKYVLSTAYSSDYALYVTYRVSYVSSSTPHPLVKLATVFLTAAYAYARINVGQAPTHRFGEVSILRDMKSFEYWYKKYQQVVGEINQKMADTREMEHQT